MNGGAHTRQRCGPTGEGGQMRRTSRRVAVLWDCAFQAGDLCARARFAWRATAKLSRHMLLHVGAML